MMRGQSANRLFKYSFDGEMEEGNLGTHCHDLFIRTNREFGRRLSFRQFGRGWEIVDVQDRKTQCRYGERTRLLGGDLSGQHARIWTGGEWQRRLTEAGGAIVMTAGLVHSNRNLIAEPHEAT